MLKKWWFRIGLALVALVVIGLVVAYVYLDAIVKRGVEKVGPAITKTDVRLEGVHVSPFSGSGELKGFVVGNPEGFKTPSAIQVQSLAISIQPGSVLADKVVVRSLKIVAPQVTFEGGLGQNNLRKILENVQSTASKDPATKEEQKAQTRKLQVDDIVITGGTVHVVASFLGDKAMAVNLPELHLSKLGQGPEGITPAELTEKVLREILQGAMKSVSSLGGDVTKPLQDLRGGAAEQLEKAKGVGDLFKKKP